MSRRRSGRGVNAAAWFYGQPSFVGGSSAPKRLSSTEMAERYGVRLSEDAARAARVERMLAVLDRMWVESGRNPLVESARTVVRLRAWTPEQWHWLAKCADPHKADAVTPPSEKTQRALLDRLEQRAHDIDVAKALPLPAAKPECSICHAVNCHSVNCAEECGIRGLPREVLPVTREIVSDFDAALGER